MSRTSPTTLKPKSRLRPFRFRPWSKRQKQIFLWWTDSSPYRDYNGIIADGSIRSGKTLSMSMSFVFWAMHTFASQDFAFCGKTIGSLRRNVINNLKRILAQRGFDVVDRRGDNLLIITKDGVTNNFWLFGGKDESSQDLIQGITLAGILFDEVALMPESFVNQATGRCSVDGAKWWFNCNPAERLHWFKREWINKYKKKKLLYIHFTMDDNLSLSEATKERYRSSYVGVFYRRYIEGLWVAAEGLIYDMWDDGLNSFALKEGGPRPFVREICTRYIAIDFGATNPTVFLDTYDDGTTFWIEKEYYHDSRDSFDKRQKTVSQYADDFEEFVGRDKGVIAIVDPSAEAFQIELSARGYNVMDADNEVLEGIRYTSTMIFKRRVMVEKNCMKFRQEIEGYIWDEKAYLRGEEKPVKVRDHAMDALRYLIKTIVSKWRLAA